MFRQVAPQAGLKALRSRVYSIQCGRIHIHIDIHYSLGGGGAVRCGQYKHLADERAAAVPLDSRPGAGTAVANGRLQHERERDRYMSGLLVRGRE